MTRREQLEGVLLGTAVGDSIGLPAEGLSRTRIVKRNWNESWKHRLFCGLGMWSDDTEHTFMVGNALLMDRKNAAAFGQSLAWKFRWWFLCIPAGVGLATARACLKLWVGFPPTRNGVFSAGNGPAMRAGIIGAVFFDDEPLRRAFVKASTEITHIDPRALTAALAVAETVAFCCRNQNSEKRDKLEWIVQLKDLGDEEWRELVPLICGASETSVGDFAALIGDGERVSGYAYETVPVAIHAWLTSDGDFRKAIESVINCGGDTDTCAAIAGSICGAETGVVSIPDEWIEHLKEWPRTKANLTEMACRLADREAKQGPVCYPWIFLPIRNLGFLTIVILHGLTRMFR